MCPNIPDRPEEALSVAGRVRGQRREARARARRQAPARTSISSCSARRTCSACIRRSRSRSRTRSARAATGSTCRSAARPRPARRIVASQAVQTGTAPVRARRRARADDRPHELARARQPLHLRRRVGRARRRAGREREGRRVGDPVDEDAVEVRRDRDPQQPRLPRPLRSEHRSTRDDKLFHQQGRKRVQGRRAARVEVHQRAHRRARPRSRRRSRATGCTRRTRSSTRSSPSGCSAASATREEAPIILDEYGNTASAGSLIAFSRHNEDLPTGSYGMMCSFGAGYSLGSLLLQRM